MQDKSRLQEKYEKDVRPVLQKELGIKNIMAVPTITKIVINSGLGAAKDDQNVIEEMTRDMALIGAQKPIVTKSKKAISNFKLKENVEIGAKVTLRRNMM